MKILVLMGCAQNPEENLYTKNNRIAYDQSTRLINDFDLIGVEAAVQLMEQGLCDEVTVFSLNADKTLVHKALAIGATKAIYTQCDDYSLTPGAIIKAVVEQFPDLSDTLIICGKTNVNFESAQVPQRLAQAIGCPCVCNAKTIRSLDNGVLVACESDSGTPIYAISTPAVITTDLRLATPRFPSLPNIMKAKRKPAIELKDVNPTPAEWDFRSAVICEPKRNRLKCQFIGASEAAYLIRDAVSAANKEATFNDKLLGSEDALMEDVTIETTISHNFILAPEDDAPVVIFITPQSISAVRRNQLTQLAKAWNVRIVLVGPEHCNVTIPIEGIESGASPAEIAEKIANEITRYNIRAIFAAQMPLTHQILAELASAAHIPFIPGIFGNAQRYICAGRLIEFITWPEMPFCATLADSDPLMFQHEASSKLTFSKFYKPVLTTFEKTGIIKPLERAKIIFSVGRGAANYVAVIASLAQNLGASLGASRAIVDMGRIDNAHQVGLTGHSVTPDLYVAFGISGAIQHLAGIRNAPKILAINTDRTAPIFEFAHYGVNADVNEVIQELYEIT